MLRVVALLSVISLTAFAGEIYGVTMADSITVEGKALKLNGMGLRTWAFFKVYVAGLYLENTATSPEAIFAADTVRRVDLQMKRDVAKTKITKAIRDGLEKNSKAQMPALQGRLDRVVTGVPDLKEGEVFSITYVPGKGTTVQGAGGQPVTVEGKDFGDAIFKTWLGQNPVDDGLKKGLLGAK